MAFESVVPGPQRRKKTRDLAVFAQAFLQFGVLSGPGSLDQAPDAISSTDRFAA